MYYFNGFMGSILHTGDFRFTNSMIYNNKILFPKDKIINKYKDLWDIHNNNNNNNNNNNSKSINVIIN
jgi:hypothetical protein